MKALGPLSKRNIIFIILVSFSVLSYLPSLSTSFSSDDYIIESVDRSGLVKKFQIILPADRKIPVLLYDGDKIIHLQKQMQ